jgi:hypothetical protein
MRIINFGQVVDLEDGTIGMGFQMTVLLPDGTRISIATDEHTIQQLTEIVVGGVEDVVVPPPAPERIYEEGPAFEAADVGGGNGGPVMGQIDEEDYEEQVMRGMVGGLGSPPRAPQPAQAQPRPPMIDEDGFMRTPVAKTVPTDEMGYPIVAQQQGPTQEELIEEEEDPGESV